MRPPLSHGLSHFVLPVSPCFMVIQRGMGNQGIRKKGKKTRAFPLGKALEIGSGARI